MSWSLFTSPYSVEEGRLVVSLDLGLFSKGLNEIVDEFVLQVVVLVFVGRFVYEALHLLENN